MIYNIYLVKHTAHCRYVGQATLIQIQEELGPKWLRGTHDIFIFEGGPHTI